MRPNVAESAISPIWGKRRLPIFAHMGEIGSQSAPMTSSVQAYARLGGILFLLSVLGGGFGEAIAPSLITVSGDATATAHHIVASNTLFRLGFAAYSVEALCDVGLAVVFYLLLRPVSVALAWFFVLFHLMATATFAFGEVFYFAPAFVLGSDSYLKSFTPEQLSTLALLSLNLYGFAASFSQVFYGVASVLLGYLMYRSGYLPRAIGAVWIVAGIFFAISTYAEILAPTYDSPFFRLPTLLGVFLLGGWLLARGVNVPKWQAMAKAAQPF